MPGPSAQPWTFGVLLSGAGRTLEYLLDAIDRNELDGRVAVVISSRPGVRGLEVAAVAGIPHFVVRRGDFDALDAFSDAMYECSSPTALTWR